MNKEFYKTEKREDVEAILEAIDMSGIDDTLKKIVEAVEDDWSKVSQADLNKLINFIKQQEKQQEKKAVMDYVMEDNKKIKEGVVYGAITGIILGFITMLGLTSDNKFCQWVSSFGGNISKTLVNSTIFGIIVSLTIFCFTMDTLSGWKILLPFGFIPLSTIIGFVLYKLLSSNRDDLK